MLICERCGDIVSLENAPVGSQKLYIDGEHIATEHYLACRHCKGMLSEAKICPACKTIYITQEEDICEDCWDDAQTLDNCLEIGRGEFMDEEVSINGFLATVYSKEDIERILIKDFKTNITLDKEKEYIYKYLDEDRDFLASWLAEKREKHNANLH